LNRNSKMRKRSVGDIPQKPKAESLKLWKRSFRGRPSKYWHILNVWWWHDAEASALNEIRLRQRRLNGANNQ
jgi:hypothetical protein